MGQEINSTRFDPNDFADFTQRLQEETRILESWIANGRCAQADPVAGFEIEAWLVDSHLRPVPLNVEFLQRLDHLYASPELAKFNIELNNTPQPLHDDALSRLRHELEALWQQVCTVAHAMNLECIMIGTLPTLCESDLTLDNMSELNRYHALNRQVLKLRGNRPVHLAIEGVQSLAVEHDDVMLEAATTSFQVHLQTSAQHAHHVYNAALMVSAPLVAASANSPYLFGLDLWTETRIPVFEQAVEVGGNAAAHGANCRVSFGSGYARQSIFECFEENLRQFPVLLPTRFDSAPQRLQHLRLHNGTIWRWNRPLVGFGNDGTPHIRIEHRVIPAGPTLDDMLANATFFYGLVEILSRMRIERELPFATVRDNFYRAARHGLQCDILWSHGANYLVGDLILKQLLPMAREGLQNMRLQSGDIDYFLAIIGERVISQRTGSAWQRAYIARHGADFTALTAAYRQHQQTGRPVHTWNLS